MQQQLLALLPSELLQAPLADGSIGCRSTSNNTMNIKRMCVVVLCAWFLILADFQNLEVCYHCEVNVQQTIQPYCVDQASAETQLQACKVVYLCNQMLCIRRKVAEQSPLLKEKSLGENNIFQDINLERTWN